MPQFYRGTPFLEHSIALSRLHDMKQVLIDGGVLTRAGVEPDDMHPDHRKNPLTMSVPITAEDQARLRLVDILTTIFPEIAQASHKISTEACRMLRVCPPYSVAFAMCHCPPYSVAFMYVPCDVSVC